MKNANELRLDSRSVLSNARAVRRNGWWTRPAIGLSLLAIGLVLALAAGPAAAWRPADSPPLGPGAIFASAEEAALDALWFASHENLVRHRGRILAGTIFRSADGYSYQAPTCSRDTVWSLSVPLVRIAYSKMDVASYVVHPRSGITSIDRAHEELGSALRRRVEDSESSTGPLFLLTPKRRVIRYAPGQEAEVLNRTERRTTVVGLH